MILVLKLRAQFRSERNPDLDSIKRHQAARRALRKDQP